jgi:hypothetical protein
MTETGLGDTGCPWRWGWWEAWPENMYVYMYLYMRYGVGPALQPCTHGTTVQRSSILASCRRWLRVGLPIRSVLRLSCFCAFCACNQVCKTRTASGPSASFSSYYHG